MNPDRWPATILVAIDGSSSARRGLEHSIQLAQTVGAKLTIITAIPNQLFGYRAGYFSFVDRHARDELHKLADSLIQEAAQLARNAGLAHVEATALEGSSEVFAQIADHLEQHSPVDLVVLGSFGHAVGDRLILGSTTQRLILEIARRGLHASVLVVP